MEEVTPATGMHRQVTIFKERKVMKKSGDLCTIDKLGRILIPVKLRRKFDLNPDDVLELYTDEERIILQRYIPYCVFCSNQDDLTEFGKKYVCKNCIEKLTNI